MAVSQSKSIQSNLSAVASEFRLLVSDFCCRFLVGRGVPEVEATAAGMQLIDQIEDVLGGQQLYIPKGLARNSLRRRAEIVAEFDGRNHGQLARKYGLGIKQVYRILKEERICASKPDAAAAPAAQSERGIDGRK